MAEKIHRVAPDVVANGAQVVAGQHTSVAAVDVISTGLSSIVSATANMDDDPVAGAQSLTVQLVNNGVGGQFRIKSWKDTATADTARIAATTFGKKVNWSAVGYA